jgi:hypothetical protein
MPKEKMDDQTVALLDKIRRDKAAIEKAEKPDWKTNASFTYVEGSSQITNIKTVSNVRELIQMGAFLIERERSFQAAAIRLKVADPPTFTWGGFSLEDWLSDFKARIAKIQIQVKKDKLEKLESRANAIISPELRRQLELEAIQKELDD